MPPCFEFSIVYSQDLFAYGDKDGESYDVKLQHPLGIATRTKNKSQLIVADSYNHKVSSTDEPVYCVISEPKNEYSLL